MELELAQRVTAEAEAGGRRARAEAEDARAVAEVAELARAGAVAHVEGAEHAWLQGLSLGVGLPTAVTPGLRAATPSSVLVPAADGS